MQNESALNTPRWGGQQRSAKAQAIWHTLASRWGTDIAQGQWVDIGCGSGDIAAHLATKVQKIVGMDPEPWPRWSGLAHDHPNLTLLVGSYDAERTVIPPESADVLICNQVYEHVPDPIGLICFIHRTLKPGGYCYFAGPNLLFPLEPHVYWPFIHWLPRRLARKIMALTGSKKVLDANSAHYWRLRSWFDGFEVYDALPLIVSAPEAYGREGFFWKILAKFPASLINALAFTSPGFVFLLKKPG